MSKIKSTLSKSLPAIIVSVMVTTAIIYAAWQEPTQEPPGGNVPAPINVGPLTQSKAGALGVLGVFQATGGSGQNVFNVINDKVGIGTVNPLYKLQVGAWNSNTSTISIMSNLNQEASLMFGYANFYNLWKIGRPANSDSLVIQRMDGGDAARFGYTSKVINFNSNLLYIDGGNGKIGIGTPNPTQKLDVVGYVRGSQGLCIGNECKTSWPRGYDCRVCVQISDRSCTSQIGELKCTPYASENGGFSDWATDANRYDPDCVRVKLECR
jgi:hypothetical protein